MSTRKTCLNDDIGTAPLLRIGHLTRNHGSGLGRRHAPSCANAMFLNPPWRRHHHDKIDAPVTAGFQQQRNIEHRGPRSGSPGPRQE